MRHKPRATCFISYNHRDQPLAGGIAQRLTDMGYRVWIDEGELRIGDSLVTAISSAIDQVDFLIALVSEHSVESDWCKKEVSLAMTGEIANRGITVLPCRVGHVAMPPTLTDKLYLQVVEDDVADATRRLDRAMKQHLAPAQALPPRQRGSGVQTQPRQPKGSQPSTRQSFDPETGVRMTGIDTNSMTSPRNDGTPGSALYIVPITLSAIPDRTWADLFVQHWDRPSAFTTMHRPGIASVSRDRIILNGTTMDEVERVHLDTLKLAVDTANSQRRALHQQQQQQAEYERGARAKHSHEQSAHEIADRLKFD